MRRAGQHVALRARLPIQRAQLQRSYSTDAAAKPAAMKPRPTPQIGFRVSAQEAWKGPFDKPVIGLAEAGSDAVLGPLVVSAVMFEAAALAKLASIEVPLLRASNQESQRRAWAEFAKQHATKHVTLETSANELNDNVEVKVHTKWMLDAAKEGKPKTKITIEDILYKKMIDAIEALGAPEGSQVAMLVPPKDLRWGRGDVRYNDMYKVRRGILALHYPNLKFIPTLKQLDPMWMYAAYALAKVSRDDTLRAIAEAQKAEVGTGYIHDWKTRNFLHVFVGRKKRSLHPVNIIRYNGWNRNVLNDWETIEKKRHQLQADEYFKQYPYMVNDPLRKTGVFRKIQDELNAKKAEEAAKRRADRISGIVKSN